MLTEITVAKLYAVNRLRVKVNRATTFLSCFVPIGEKQVGPLKHFALIHVLLAWDLWLVSWKWWRPRSSGHGNICQMANTWCHGFITRVMKWRTVVKWSKMDTCLHYNLQVIILLTNVSSSATNPTLSPCPKCLVPLGPPLSHTSYPRNDRLSLYTTVNFCTLPHKDCSATQYNRLIRSSL